MLGQNARQTFYDRPPQRQADAELQQEAMELIDCFGAVTHQRLTHAMQY
jgi:ubiquitin